MTRAPRVRCNPARYRDRALQLRAEAEQVSNPEARQALLNIAGNYEQLAKTLDANDARRSKS